MFIQRHGAVNGVSGSCHQLHIDQQYSVSVDCGLFQGAETANNSSKEALNKIKHHRHPLNFGQLVTIDSHEEHIRTVNYLASRNKPAIVIAASGMCSGGRIVNYLERFLTDKTADVIFVGYQAEGTLGRDIQHYGDLSRGKVGYVYINNQRLDINAKVHTISGYSAHADQKGLINFVKRMKIKPKKIKIVHGDEKAKSALKNIYERSFPSVKVIIPI